MNRLFLLIAALSLSLDAQTVSGPSRGGGASGTETPAANAVPKSGSSGKLDQGWIDFTGYASVPGALATTGASPSCDLGSDHSVVVCTQTLAADVTGATVANLFAGAKFSWMWTQAVGPYTVAYVGATNTCDVSPTNGVVTIQHFISPDGVTLIGDGCETTDSAVVFAGPEGTAVTTTASGKGAMTADSSTHTVVYYGNNSANRHAMPRVASGDRLQSSDLSDASNVPLMNGTNAYTGTQNSSGTAHSIPAKTGIAASKPGTCTVGEMYFATDATAGQNWYYCTASNTWTQQLNNGGGAGCTVGGASGDLQKNNGSSGCAASGLNDDGTVLQTTEAFGFIVTAGSGGVTANRLVTKSATAPLNYIANAGTGSIHGVAATTASATATFALIDAGIIPITVEGSVTSGHYCQAGVSDKTKCYDSGQSARSLICSSVNLAGVFQASGTDGQNVNVKVTPLLNGTKNCAADLTGFTHTFGALFDGGGSALTAGAGVNGGYVTIPYACTVTAWDAMVDTGTATFKVLKVATGTAIPTSSINTSGVGVSSNTAVHSTTLSDFTTTAIAANDIVAINLSATTGSPTKATFQVQCQ